MTDSGYVVLAVFVLIAGMLLAALWGELRSNGPIRLRTWAFALGTVGVLCFFAQIGSVFGAFDWLSPSVEWPVGHASGVLTTPEGDHVVPMPFAGRLQIYDSDWSFLRGWRVAAAGGSYIVRSDGGDLVVSSGRGGKRFVYSMEGELKGTGSYSARAESGSGTDSAWVPTPVWSYPLAGPIPAVLCAVIGFGLVGASSGTSSFRKR